MQKLDNLYVSELEFEESGMRGPKGESGDAPSLSISKVAPYLYKADLKHYDYQEGETFVRQHYPDMDAGACASIIKGNNIGHNYDERYDETAEFVVRTPAKNGLNGVIGIAAIPGVLTMDMVDAEKESELVKQAYDVLPLFMIDGMNDKGVTVVIHHMPEEDENNSLSDDSGMCALFAARYLLDNASTAEEAVNLLSGKQFWFPKNDSVKSGFYLLISDKTSIYKADLIGNFEMVKIGEYPILTNFRTIGWNGEYETLEEHANGIERYNILKDAYDSIETEYEMMLALSDVRYTGAYDTSKDNFWYSDYNGDWSALGFGDLTIHSAHEDYAAAVIYSYNKFTNRQRDGQTMQTVHSVVYDNENLTMSVRVQEEDHIYRFCMDAMDLMYDEIERAKAAEQAIRDDFANTFYNKSEVDGALLSMKDEVLENVSDHYYDCTAVENMVSDMHEQISEETDEKLEGKADAFENEGEPGQVLYKTETGAAWDDLPQRLPDVTVEDDNKVLAVEDGVWVATDKFADYFRYVNLTVTIGSDNGGVPTGGIIVTVKNNDTGDVINQEEYKGQPVTFRVPRGLNYKIEQSGNWEGYHNPTPDKIEGAATNDVNCVFTYEAIKVPETLRELQIIVDSGSAASLANHIGLQFEDTYTEGINEYQIIWDLKDVISVEDENGQEHTGVVLEWHYATPSQIPFDAPEKLEVNLEEEPVALEGVYYYGLSSNTYKLLTVNAGDPLPTTYEGIYKNSIRNTDATIIRRGYSHYGESAIRKWLNSDKPAGEWWESSHVGDVAPEQAGTMAGFINGCSDQILSMVKPVKIRFAVTQESYETVCDRFFIPSVDEVFGLSHNVSEGVPWQDWVEATGLSEPGNEANAGRRILGISTEVPVNNVGLRTANVGYQYIVWGIKSNGSLDGYANASTQYYHTPCCVIY